VKGPFSNRPSEAHEEHVTPREVALLGYRPTRRRRCVGAELPADVSRGSHRLRRLLCARGGSGLETSNTKVRFGPLSVTVMVSASLRAKLSASCLFLRW